MASVKLVNGNPHPLHHHSLYSHPLHHHRPFIHHPLPLVKLPSSPPVAPGHPPNSTAAMTLDYSLPNRSRLGDADHQIELTLTNSNSGGDSIDHDDDDNSSSNSSSRPRSHQSYLDSRSGNGDVRCNSSSRTSSVHDIKPSSPPSPHPISLQHSSFTTGSENPDPQGTLDVNTPTKKNKRKLSEPRKLRSELDEDDSSAIHVPSSPSPQTEEVNSPISTNLTDDSDEENFPPAIKIPKFTSEAHVSVDKLELDHPIPKDSSSTSSTKHKSHSSRRNKQSSPTTNDQFSSSSTPPPSASSSSPSSSSSPHITQSHKPPSDNDHAGVYDKPASSMPPSPFLHPFLSAVPPAAFGLVPGLYLPTQPYPPSALPATFPGIPLHLQQSYFAAAAAAAAAQSAGSSSISSPLRSSSPSSSSTAAATVSVAHKQPACPSSSTSRIPESIESSQLYKHRDSSSSHPVILQPPQLHTSHHSSHKPSHLASGSGFSAGGSNAMKSTTPSPMPKVPQPPQPTSSSTSSSSHFQQRAAQSSLLDNEINDEDDDDCASSSQVHSPEDLSMGGKMSRKHRKNYKNMTRERRVEANARERTRVHTISAAFDALRRAVPSYSYNQKLSKLAILRIACSYIMSLARLADMDYTSASEHIQRPLTFAECVDMCTSTIQTEGRARRRH